jgi:hypothetical protein
LAQPANYQRLIDNIKTHVPGVIDNNVEPELFEIARDFCQNTNCYKNIEIITVSSATNDYTLNPLASAQIKRITGIADVTNTTQPPYRPVQWPHGLVMPVTLRLYQQLSNTYSWRVEYAMYPVDPVDANDDPVMPSWILDNYQDAFLWGVRARLHMQSAKPYSNPALGAAAWRMYLQRRGLAAAEVNRENLYDGQNWMFSGAYTTYGRQRGV